MNTARVRQSTVDTLKAITPVSARRRLVRARLATRFRTADMRLLPDFVIIGGQRCGTSSLYKYLGLHPQVAPSLRKETEYFTIEYGEGESWYRAHFPLSARRSLAERRGRTLLTFEATPDYLFDPRAPQRLADLLPDARLIIMLRDPVERAFSHYLHNIRLGLEDMSFRDAIAAEDERLAPDLEAIHSGTVERVTNFRRFSYVARGQYTDQIARWFDRFDRDRFLILAAEEFFEHPENALHAIERFVGVDEWSPPEFTNYSYAGTPDADNADLPPDLRIELRDRFVVSNAALEPLTGMALPWVDAS